MRLRVFTAIGMLGFVAAARAQAPAPAPPSAQQMFDAGEDAIGAGRYDLAVDTFGALETRMAAKLPTGRSLAVARLRLGQSLARLRRYDEAIAKLDPAAAGLDRPADTDLRRQALEDLADAEYATFAWGSAHGHASAALALVPKTGKDAGAEAIGLRTLMARAEMFDDPAKAAADLKAGLPGAQAAFADGKPQLGQYWQLYGRALLNAGQRRQARAAFDKAVASTGGLTEHVSRAAASARADAALAAQLDKDDVGVIKFTAYTGAGTMAHASLRLPADANPPPCGGPAQIAPDDYAVVQFSIDDDGSVRGAEPVYASRSGPMALAFARAVSEWSWTRAEALAVNRFFRSATRVELRCTTRADKQSADDLLKPDYDRWAAGLGASPLPEDASKAAEAAKLRAMLAQTEASAGAASPRLVPILVALARNPSLNGFEQNRFARRAATLARASGAPPTVQAWLSVPDVVVASGTRWEDYRDGKVRQAVALAHSPDYAGAPRARAWLLVTAAELVASDPNGLPQARAMLEQVVAMPPADLPADDPVRRAAGVRLASLQAARGEQDAARATYAQTGLAPNQCAILDTKPIVKKRSVSSNDYPILLARFGAGFEGWAVTEFDVTNAGRTENTRVLIAWPPFLFGENAAAISKHTVYQPSFRPDGALSCGGYRDRVAFKSPDLPK